MFLYVKDFQEGQRSKVCALPPAQPPILSPLSSLSPEATQLHPSPPSIPSPPVSPPLRYLPVFQAKWEEWQRRHDMSFSPWQRRPRGPRQGEPESERHKGSFPPGSNGVSLLDVKGIIAGIITPVFLLLFTSNLWAETDPHTNKPFLLKTVVSALTDAWQPSVETLNLLKDVWRRVKLALSPLWSGSSRAFEARRV